MNTSNFKFHSSLFALLICLFGSLCLLGQTDTSYTVINAGEIEEVEEAEEGEFKRKHIEINLNNPVVFNDGTDLRFFLLDIGFSTYLHDGSINLPAELDSYELLYNGSLNFNVHFIRHRIPLTRNKLLSFEYGLSLSFMQYKFANDFRLSTDDIPITLEPAAEPYKRSKLKTNFLEVPVLFTIKPGRRKSVYLSAGWYASVLLNSKQKIRTENKETIRIRDDFNLNKFRHGLMARIGLGPIAFYGQIALNDLFKDNQGPVLQPFNFGITVLNF